VDTLVAAIAGFLIIFAFTRHSGIGISPDSVVYLSTARNAFQYGSYKDFDGNALVIFPLLYPGFLNFWMIITRLDPLVFVPLLNASLFAMLIYISGRMIEGFVNHSRWYLQIALFGLMLSPCMLEIYSMMWSETLFMLLFLFFILSLSRYLKNPGISRLLFLSLITGMACLTRYAGITLIATGVLMIFFSFHSSFKKKILNILLFGLISSSMLGANLIRNHLYSSTLTGNREKSLSSLSDNIGNFGAILCTWLPLPENSLWLSFVIAVILLIIFIVVFIRRRHSHMHYESYENISTCFFAVYGLFMILSATMSRYETFSSRLVSPAFIPMVWGGSSMIILYRDTVSKEKKFWVTLFTLLIFGCFQIKQLQNDFENYDGIKDAGVPGYTEDPWNTDSEIVNFLRNHFNGFQKGYTLYSNSDDAVYFYTGLPCTMLPHEISEREKTKYYNNDKCYLIWFDDTVNIELFSQDQAVSHPRMRILYRFSNGVIYITTENAIQ
jgi:hypothetical protein